MRSRAGARCRSRPGLSAGGQPRSRRGSARSTPLSTPLLLALYRAATFVGEPASGLFLRWRERRGKEDPIRWPERHGEAGLPRPEGPLVWLHGASVGEGLALLPLVEALVAEGYRVLVTTGTVTSSRLLADRLPPGALHQYVPLDTPRAVRRFLDHWRPALIGFAESELWPNLLGAARQRGIPTVLVNARMSERSFGRWRLLPGTIGHLLSGLDLVLAQSDADAKRYAALGAAPVRSTSNVKFDAAPPAVDDDVLRVLRETVGTRPVWLAASTHAGEDEICCDVHKALAPALPGLLTVLMPRKPDRGPAIETAARSRGLVVATRSLGALPAAATDLYLADTMGEMGPFLRMAAVVFVGKSLVGSGGGQNPIEAAQVGTAILHGPAVANFRDVYAMFDAAGASRVVPDAGALTQAVVTLLTDPTARAEMARRASAVVTDNAGSTARTLAALEPWLARVRSSEPS